LCQGCTWKRSLVVILPDDIIHYKESVTGQLIKKFEELDLPVIALTEVPIEETHKYGIVSVEKQLDERTYLLKDMVEKPKTTPPSNLAIIVDTF